MSGSTLYPPGHSIHQAIAEFSRLLIDQPEKTREKHLQNIAVQFDLSPRDFEFLKRQCLTEESDTQ